MSDQVGTLEDRFSCVTAAMKDISEQQPLTNFSLLSYLWHIGKQCSSRCDAAICGGLSGTILFASKNLIR